MSNLPHNESDTVAAIATAPGEGGVAIVRLSGPLAFPIADTIFRGPATPPSKQPTHVILHGTITTGAAEVDDVLLLLMRAPRSYTREDVVEIQGHGGPVTARRILRCVINAGARLAEPGEFTRRAFLNGRLDLLQAEAVLDLVRARTDRAASAAVEQLEGSLSRVFTDLYDRILSVATDLEAALDFPDDELPPIHTPDILARLRETLSLSNQLLATWDEGHILRDGAIAVITGKPNVGKSTMLNAVLGRSRAIVSPRPGTTRDTIEEYVSLDGIPLRLVDTAGLRASDCDIEIEGIRRTHEHVAKADIRIHMLDASTSLDATDREHLATLNPSRSIVVLNKTDLGCAISAGELATHRVVRTSLVSGQGVDDVKRALLSVLSSNFDLHAPPHAVISERHRSLLVAAVDELNAAEALIASGAEDATVPAAQSLRVALERLGEITGRAYTDELLTSVFSRFCIGK